MLCETFRYQKLFRKAEGSAVHSNVEQDLALHIHRRYCWKKKDLQVLKGILERKGIDHGWKEHLKTQRKGAPLYAISDNLRGIFGNLCGLIYFKSSHLTPKDQILLEIFESQYRHRFSRRYFWPIIYTVLAGVVTAILFWFRILTF